MRVSKFRDWPLASKVIAAQTVMLLPLGVLATVVTASAYRQVLDNRGEVSPERWLGLAVPLLMWLTALLIGWRLAERMLVRPLTRMRDLVDRYGQGETLIRLGATGFYSQEVAALAAAFDRLADDTARHEAAIIAALDEQRRLTREVHHRVKNNLQIVASLLSIQARDAESADVARAYSTIQARVGALALVHRWMYDDERARGVDLRALSTDLCASLEQTSGASTARAPRLHCAVERFVVAQDTAVPVAFLITELVGVAARIAAPEAAEVTVTATATGATALLTIASPSFAADPLAGNTAATTRIITGMARQMRVPLVHDAAAPSYSVEFGIPNLE